MRKLLITILAGLLVTGFVAATVQFQSNKGVPKTGQTVSEVDYDDAYYLKGYPAIGDRFTNNGDGTITDNGTGLMWPADGNGGGCFSGGTKNWADAITFCEGLTFAGHSDWRLPNVKALMSIVDYGEYSPAIDETFFSNTQSDYYWSSTTYVDDTDLAWYVNFIYGSVYPDGKASSYYVRCVRGQ